MSNPKNNTPTVLYPKQILKDNILFFFLLFVLTFFIYGNTLNGQFLSADDLPGIVNNPMVMDLQGSLNSFELEKVLPAVFYAMFGMSPIPFHIFSILLHLTDAILVFVFAYMLFGKTEAVITSLVFLLHPINSETVSWISAYGYLIYCMVILIIFINYLLFHKTTDKKYLYIGIAVYLVAIIFYRKPWVALIPVYVALLDQLILETKINFKKISAYIWFAVPTVIYLITYIRSLLVVRENLLTTLYYNDPTRATPYLNRVLYTIFMTFKLFVWPMDLTIYHEGEKVISVGFFTVMSAIVTLGLISLVIYLFVKSPKKGPHYRYIAACIVIIYSTMLLSFYPTVVVWAMAERYLYVASIFFGLIISILYIRSKNKTTANYVLTILFLFYAGRTFARTFAWKNSKNLWIATQKVSPYSYRVYNNLGDIYANEGNYALAIQNFQMSLQMEPTFADAVHNLGFTYYQVGDVETAKYYFQKSFEMNPHLYQSVYKLGVIAFQQGDTDLARQYFMKTLEVNPAFDTAKNSIRALDSIPSTAPKN